LLAEKNGWTGVKKGFGVGLGVTLGVAATIGADSALSVTGLIIST